MSTLNIPLFYRIENSSLNCPHLPTDPELGLTISCSNYPCLEQISMVPKMFEPLKFDYMYAEIQSLTVLEIDKNWALLAAISLLSFSLVTSLAYEVCQG